MSDFAAPILGSAELQFLALLDRRLIALAHDCDAQERQYPALIARGALEQAEYPQAFAHLLLSAAPLRNPEQVVGRVALSDNLGDVSWCLSPAVCYHVYAELAGCTLEQGLSLTARGRCFRHEATVCPGLRQIEFEMRELVWIGASEWVEQQLAKGRQQLTALADELGLAGEWVVAEDPFFLPAAQGKAYLQRLQETKLEYQSTDDAVALASINRHGSFFSSRFGIVDRRGKNVHTACLAVGLDRWRSRLSDLSVKRSCR